jgi:hypothetical protein
VGDDRRPVHRYTASSWCSGTGGGRGEAPAQSGGSRRDAARGSRLARPAVIAEPSRRPTSRTAARSHRDGSAGPLQRSPPVCAGLWAASPGVDRPVSAPIPHLRSHRLSDGQLVEDVVHVIESLTGIELVSGR